MRRATTTAILGLALLAGACSGAGDPGSGAPAATELSGRDTRTANATAEAQDTTTTIPAAPTVTSPVPTTPPPTTTARKGTVFVVGVVDGDTIDVDTGERVRVIGVDTPERGRCGAAEATAATISLVANKEVVLTPGTQNDRDRYGRILRYVDVDGVDLGLELLRQGLAVARYDSRDGYGRHDREATYVAASPSVVAGC